MTTLSKEFPRAYLDPDLLAGTCSEVTFAPGEKLRVKGLLSVDMYIITRGEVEICIDGSPDAGHRFTVSRGSPIGEIGFITGVPATATVTAKTDVGALYIDKSTWRAFELQLPQAAVAFYRELSEISEGRQSYNLLFTEAGKNADRAVATEIILCRRPEQLLAAQRIRYKVYCEELGRTSPYADPVKKIIADDLDVTGHVLLAIANGKSVATMRMNMSRDGGLGILEELYGMRTCTNHPKNTGIVTKFIVSKEHRFGQIAFKLMATAVEMAQRYDIKDCFMDCVPQLKPFYVALGFAQSGPPFLHHENGRSHPLRLDIDRYFKRVTRLAGITAGTSSNRR
ncbi:MAG: cyclic nucleotide-binding domain-containing protein [Hyphomicrobiaceae bacterium]